MSFSRKFRRAHRTSPSSLLLSHVRPEYWDAATGSSLGEWDSITNDWFIYTVDHLEGLSTRSIQLLANRDGTYFLIRSPQFRKETGVLTLEQRRIIEDLFTPANIQSFLADSLEPFERQLTPARPVLHNTLWAVPRQLASGACWGESNLSPATRNMIATFERLLATLCGLDAVSDNPSFSN